MIINFLQTRDPPILPALQQGPFLQPEFMSGLNVAFDKNVSLYRGYGLHNKDSLGLLLFQFFRYYGHEFDFETSVMSVRAGKVITKLEKSWHFLQDNRLCVEEPFNTSRNLGNTADDTSVRGIHLELRRAFDMLSEANLAKCCDEYVPPANLVDAPRPLERERNSANRPTLAHSAATAARSGGGSSRGGRPHQQPHRSPNPGRRASSASTRGNAYPQGLSLGSNLAQTELSLQAQHQQHLLHDRLYLQYQFLQAQEQELRAQLHQQAVLQGRMVPIAPYPHFLIPFGAYAGGQEELIRARAGMISSQPPPSAPLRPHGFSFSTYGGRAPGLGSTTNPPSPLLQSVRPDSRRSFRRSSMSNGSSGASMRAQSQPPRLVPSPLSFRNIAEKRHEYSPRVQYHVGEDLAPRSSRVQEFVDAVAGAQGRIYQNLGTGRTGSEYIGYYLGHSPPLPTYSRSVIGTPVNCSTGLGIESGGISPQVLAQLSSSQLSIPASCSEPSRSPSIEMRMSRTVPLEEPTFQEANRSAYASSRPMSNPSAVNNSAKWETKRQSIIDLHDSLNTTNFDTSTSDDVAVETPTSSDDCSQGIPEPKNVDNESTSVRNVLTTRIEPSRNQKGSRRFPRSVNESPDFSVAGSQSKPSAVPILVENERPTGNGVTRTPEHIMVSGVGGASIGNGQLPSKPFQLSPVKEVRTPTPTKSRQLSAPESAAQGLPKSRTKGKAKQKKSALSSADQGEDKAETLASQPNGQMLAAHRPPQTNNTGGIVGWQTQKKKSKHKKGSKSETDLKAINTVGGDFLPLDESLRKGG
jgi:Cid1 family poly A polymerase